MHTALVTATGYVEHPESGANLLRITTNMPWAVAGVTYPSTDIWVVDKCPEPPFGACVQWDDDHAWVGGVKYRKPEMDSSPAAPLA